MKLYSRENKEHNKEKHQKNTSYSNKEIKLQLNLFIRKIIPNGKEPKQSAKELIFP